MEEIITKKETRGRKPSKDKAQHYVDDEEFTKKVLEYYEQLKVNPNKVPSNYLCLCLVKIAEGFSHASNFINYSYRDDMVGDAKIKMYKALIEQKYRHEGESIDPETGEAIRARNAFSYFSTIARFSFIARIKREKKNHLAIENYKDSIFNELISEQIDASFDSQSHTHDEE